MNHFSCSVHKSLPQAWYRGQFVTWQHGPCNMVLRMNHVALGVSFYLFKGGCVCWADCRRLLVLGSGFCFVPCLPACVCKLR